MRGNYKLLLGAQTIESLTVWAREVVRSRASDILDYEEQQAVNPRIYTRIPASSSDLLGTEKAGDIAVDTGYIYVVTDNAGVLQWQRVATATF